MSLESSLRDIDFEAEDAAARSTDDKLAAAKQYLGENHLLHPAYQFRERHAFDPVRWAPHSVLRPVQMAAQQAGRI